MSFSCGCIESCAIYAFTRYLALLYDADAISYTAAATDGTFDGARHDPFSGDGLLIRPLQYDAEVGKDSSLQKWSKYGKYCFPRQCASANCADEMMAIG